jgi:hypothetical protein
MNFLRRQRVVPQCRRCPRRHLLTASWASTISRFPHPHMSQNPLRFHLPLPCIGVLEGQPLPPCANHSICHPSRARARALHLFNMLRITPPGLQPQSEQVSQVSQDQDHQSRSRGLWSSRPPSSRPVPTSLDCARARLCASSESSMTSGAWCSVSVAPMQRRVSSHASVCPSAQAWSRTM